MRNLLSLRVLILAAVLGTSIAGCGGGDSPSDPGPVNDVPDATADLPADLTADVPADVLADVPVDIPAEVEDLPPSDLSDLAVEDKGPGEPCLGSIPEGKVVRVPGLAANVDVVRDKWGIPHIFATTEADAFRAQGFMTGMDRAAAIQAMRLILQGRFAAAKGGGPGELSTDAYMRLLDMYGVAGRIWTNLQTADPELAALIEAYSGGVSDYIQAVKTKKIAGPVEWAFLEPWDAWTPVDSLAMGRLQSWDLSFDQYITEIDLMGLMRGLQAKVAGTTNQGLMLDAFRVQPGGPDTVLPPPGKKAKAAAVVATAKAIELPAALRNLPASYFSRLATTLRQPRMQPGVMIGAGSNNWAVAPAHTADGKAILANDPHLALRNPAVFHLVHMDTTRAGGTLSIAGASFPGIPGVILGHNAFAAWAGTVHNYDVTDVYIETFVAGDMGKVKFDGGEVALTSRDEVFTYAKPTAGCESALTDFLGALKPVVADKGTTCELTLTLEYVPHHGPIIPGSRTKDGDNNDIALTWKWTGFEPSEDIQAVSGLWRMKTPEEFIAAISKFGVGAQNWVYADVDGNIAWAPFAKVPIRKHLAAGAKTPVPWLPMPGDGSCEWTGYVPVEQLPQALNPASGLILTANNDPNGLTLDGDPLNDGPNYLGHTYDIGFRATRARELLNALLVRGDLTVADMQTVQADHQSPMGLRLTPGLLAAIQAAVDAREGVVGSDPALAGFATATVEAAAAYLKDWTFDAAAGVDVGGGVTATQATDAVATAIFNAWLVFLEEALFPNKGLANLPDQFKAKLLTALFVAPNTLATWSVDLQDSAVWDDLSTVDDVETRNPVILKALADALVWLADPAKIGPRQQGGFGVDDMTKWTWGSLHTLTLPSALGSEANIPAGSAWRDGFPRPGDSFVVDASNPGLSDLDFTYTHGPSQRPVYHMDAAAGIPNQNALPGGEIGSFPNAHYRDDFELWARNQSHPVHSTVTPLIPDAESCLRLAKP
jgi:penicillin amidase